MLSKKTTFILFFISIAVFLFGSGYKLGEYNTSLKKLERPNYNIINFTNPSLSIPKTNGLRSLDFSLFWDTWGEIEKKFIDKGKLDPQKMFYGAIKGMVASLGDPYTFFLNPDENKHSKDDLGGKFEGIGAQLGLKDNRIIIIAPLKNSPAEKAGIKPGDFINKVNDISTANWTLTQAVTKIRGPKSTTVKLTLERNNKEFTSEIVRNMIQIISVELSYETNSNCKNSCPKVAYLKLNQFGDNTNDEWDREIKVIKSDWDKKIIRGMVLDIRDNPGGFLEGAIYTASDFLTQNKLVLKQESTIKDNKNYYVERKGNLLDIPLVVVINKYSASASEILAGALRDNKRAVLIGEKTFGKGSVQEAVDLKEGAGLHITVAKWILPGGEWINGKGIEPDIKVENKISEGNTLTRKQDIQLEKAIEQALK